MATGMSPIIRNKMIASIHSTHTYLKPPKHPQLHDIGHAAVSDISGEIILPIVLLVPDDGVSLAISVKSQLLQRLPERLLQGNIDDRPPNLRAIFAVSSSRLCWHYFHAAVLEGRGLAAKQNRPRHYKDVEHVLMTMDVQSENEYY
ncbi:predicted protein [Aspergillus nidulans FGSC A4]|uniref:Uncharacterized protein n=1 Tax=Emericella nidulans (strain FGSC A4 / ATCC 38163 / CBS 112.46 / NRRL 194 / M139) TaxID=227321 RepID=Q5BA80_EMENI|nr:hypothetical protein [Aspergillus nidulans FGSC A4]EAA64655.1 predicted protein [Aspergillus nidulans FGSC A4]CBF87078.1 TPA: conserved hypothetical protein [Aspergillus nidulans FGSC A4]|eukprot:XP_660154.1 predicted protein [Aspergillus nidulans FGSC A4]